MDIRPYGERAILVECGEPAVVHALHAALRAADLPGVDDLVPGLDSLLVRGDGAAALADSLAARPLPAPTAGLGRLVEVATHYDGADLAEVAALTGLPAAEVARRHATPTYTVAFVGFAPGFPYLLGLDPTLCVPRRDTPRTRVPAGSVAIAAEFAGIYPRSSPGGWRLLGRTDLVLFDERRDPPALLTPGDRVRFLPR